MGEIWESYPQLAAVPSFSSDVKGSLLPLRAQACFFTGHRTMFKPVDPHTPTGAVRPHPEVLRQCLAHEVESLVYQGFSVFYCGAARGFDLQAAAAVLRLKKDHPHLRLILLLPCRDQIRGWSEEDIALYLAVLAQSEAYCLQETYDRGCMQRRNRMLVDLSAAGIAYYDESRFRSGTGMTVRCAASQGRPVIMLYPICMRESE